MPAQALPSPSWIRHAWQVVPWLPALLTLALIAALRVSVPYTDSWWYVKAYLDWQQGHYGLRELFATHGAHPTVPGKLIYWFALQVTEGDVGWLPVLAWLFSLVIALSCRALIRAQVPNDTRAQWWLMLLANSIIFTTAQSSAWLWDFLFQNFIAGACLMGALWCLAQPGAARRRMLGAGVLSLVAATAFGSGFTVAWLLLPLLGWRVREEKLSLRWLAGGVLLALFVTWLALSLLPSLNDHSAHNGPGERVEGLVGRPLMAIKYVLLVLGGLLGHGTSVDPEDLRAIIGGLGVLMFLACFWQLWRRRRDTALLAAAWPWLACCGFTLLNVALITLGRMNNTLYTAMAPRYLTMTLFFYLGVVMLVALLLRNHEHRWPRWLGPVVTLFLTLQAVNWADGVQAMRHFHHLLMQNRAAMTFAKVLPLEPDRVWQLGFAGTVTNAAIPLHDQDRLRGVKMLTDTRLASLRTASAMSAGTSHVDFVGRNADGKVVVQGQCAGVKEVADVPDLILVTAVVPGQEERIVAFQFPMMPPEFFADRNRQRQQKDYYRGFRVTLDQAPVPADPGTRLRAYAYFQERQTTRRISGEFAVP